VWKQVATSSVGEPAKVANAWEALRQYVLGKAAQKLLTGKSQGTSLVAMSVVLPAEGHPGRADREKAMVGDGDPMGIASEVMQDVLGSTKGRLGVDDPVLLKQSAQERVERLRVGEREAVSVERQLLVVKDAA
jgi:hypothetical protein